nr:restriction endonuclease subunit S [Elizabethkingia sp. M8]
MDLKSAKYGTIPRISVQTTNNGIIGFFDESTQNARYFENFISVNFFGISYYHPYRASVEMKVHVLKLQNHKFTHHEGVFISGILNRYFNGKYTYGNQLSSSKLKYEDFKIQLPTQNGKIDFEFMESFIAELEAERIAELEAYLLATGLKDYSLTEQEEQALKDFEKLQFISTNVIDIFDVKNTRSILSKDIAKNSGTTPYLCASADNNAVSSYISYDEKYLDKGNCVFIGGKTFVVSYQEKDFYSNDSHNLALYLKSNEHRNRLSQLYLATCINKSLGHKYSWGNSIGNKKIQTDKVSLPVKNGKPDFETMETFISAIQKLVIKDVVLYADRKIEATKSVVSR